MGKLKLLMLLALFCAIQCVYAQKKITGRVTDKDGSPMQGVTVTIKNTNLSTITASDGTYSISAEGQVILVFTSIGYQTVEVKSNGNTNVTMNTGNNALSEVVVVGYGSRLKTDVTGSIAKVSGKEITNTPAPSFETAIQGRAAGVLVQQQNGKLGQGINIRIRGASSVSAGNEPLYVVDGVPVISDNLSSNGAATDALADLNMNDIESIDILKDASAAAIYGSRASNGVVLITTKKGRAGTSRIDFNYYTGLQYPTGHRKFMNATQWVNFFEQAALGAAKQDLILGIDTTLDQANAAEKAFVERRFTRYSAGNNDWQKGKVNTNWEDQAFQRAPISEYDLSFSGGTDKTHYFASGQYFDQTGIIAKNSLKRYSGRLNFDHQVKNWLTLGINVSYAHTENNRPTNDNQFSTPLQIVALSPITPIIDPRTGMISGELDTVTGRPNTTYPLYYNPMISYYNAFYKTMVNRTIGDIYGNFNIAKGLTFRSELGLDQLNQTEEAYRGRLTARDQGVPNGYGYYIATQAQHVNTNNYFHYTTNFNKYHDLDVTAGMSYEKGSNTFVEADAQGFPSDSYQKLSSAAQKIQATSGSTENTLLSYFLRANYKFNDKFLVALSGRSDGSSRFGVNHRYGVFPAASAGWIISKEHFLESTQWLSFLKIKASYGLTGNQSIGDFLSRPLYTGAAYGGVPGQSQFQLANPNLKWESTAGTDAGIEIGLFQNRISIEFDVYQRLTRDLLLNVPIPGTSGFAYQYRNVGGLTNKGFEITLNTVNVASRNFRWTTNINFSLNRNKITDLGPNAQSFSDGGQNYAMVGQSLGIFVAREFAGVDPANGDALYFKNTLKSDGSRDRTTTNQYNEASDVVIGDPTPKFVYGFDNVFTCRSFDAEVLLQGIYGNKIYNGGGQYMSASGSTGFDNQTLDQLNAWKKPGDVTNVPEARLFYPNGTDPSSRYISDGSYLRVKTVSLGYTLPGRLSKRIRLERVRIYFRALNLFTITKYKGWDPEVNADYQASNINQGVDFYSAPQIKSFVFGVNIGL